MTYRDHVSTETLADHAEGLLGESEAGQVQAHLDDCEDCRSEALLLVSLQEILRADDPGPMPAEYASRIDAALAELVAAEPPRRLHPEAVPILNAAAEADAAEAGGAKVIDLASRRAVMMTGLRRVSTVAAGVVLLIGGAALGVQTLGNHTDLVPGPSDQAIAPARSFDTLPTPPTTATKGKHGIKTDQKTGWIYMPSGKVLLPDGTVILPGATKADKPTVITPKQKSTGGVQAIKPKTPTKPGKAPQNPQTGTQPAPAPVTPATAAPATPAAQPATPAAKPTSKAADDGKQQVGVTSVPGKSSKASQAAAKDTYVSQSGSEYTQDNFAGKVRDLMTQASQGSSSPGTYTSTSSGTAQPDPTTSPTVGPTTGPSPSISPQNLAVSYRQFDAPPTPPTAPGRGPADPEVKARVQRCATQLQTIALAGDEGIWLGHKATIVVTPTPDNPNQVIGYVFYGNCTKYAPATADTAQWEQRVDKPAPADSNQQSAPVKRVGGTSPNDGARSESFER